MAGEYHRNLEGNIFIQFSKGNPRVFRVGSRKGIADGEPEATRNHAAGGVSGGGFDRGRADDTARFHCGREAALERIIGVQCNQAALMLVLKCHHLFARQYIINGHDTDRIDWG